MINITVSDKNFVSHTAGCYAFLVEQDFVFSKELKNIAKEFYPDLELYLSKRGFTGKKLEMQAVPFIKNDAVSYIILVGLGRHDDKKGVAIEVYRRSIALIARKVQALKYESLVFKLPSTSIFGLTINVLAEKATVMFNVATYHFNEFITDDTRKATEIIDIALCVDTKNKKNAQDGTKVGECIAKAVNKARHWVDLPPSMLTPPHLVDKARKIAKDSNLGIKVFNEKQINEMGMGGLAAVSRGSQIDCALLILEYKTKKKNAPTIAYVGKGITFDSGGLSLKPAIHMETMKEDMSGAAAVIATMEALAALKPDVNVVGITPLAENLPSGIATKPGDIVRFYNGKTAEIKNTDAEGRLILADALAYAVKEYKPDAIIDIATLTGACAYALGPFYTGLMSEHDDLVEQIQHASDYSGDPIWRLPMNDDYKVAIKSEVADLCNIGGSKYMAGAITAACFLQNFVGDIPWAHLDIAGTAFNVPDLPYYRPGATGAGVRLFIDLALNWK